MKATEMANKPQRTSRANRGGTLTGSGLDLETRIFSASGRGGTFFLTSPFIELIEVFPNAWISISNAKRVGIWKWVFAWIIGDPDRTPPFSSMPEVGSDERASGKRRRIGEVELVAVRVRDDHEPVAPLPVHIHPARRHRER
jgi:hypothetical protein